MKRADIFNIDLAGKTVVIIGSPASGKTTLANDLQRATGRSVIHADDYMSHGWKEALYVMMADLLETPEPVIVEGVQAYRLLRKGVETGMFYPDVVIELKATDEQVKRVYATERQGKRLDNVSHFNKMLNTILASYKAIENPHPPQWIEVENEF